MSNVVVIDVDGLGGDQQVISFSLHQPPNLANLPKTENLRSATLGGRWVWSGGLRARILDRFEASARALIRRLHHRDPLEAIKNGELMRRSNKE